jgi:hypothetical protein
MTFIADDELPKTATQFSFRIDILPGLFGYQKICIVKYSPAFLV